MFRVLDMLRPEVGEKLATCRRVVRRLRWETPVTVARVAPVIGTLRVPFRLQTAHGVCLLLGAATSLKSCPPPTNQLRRNDAAVAIRPFQIALLLVVVTAVVYVNSLAAPFLFDDWLFIGEDGLIRQAWIGTRGSISIGPSRLGRSSGTMSWGADSLPGNIG